MTVCLVLVTEKEGEMDLPSLVAGSSDAGEHDDETDDDDYGDGAGMVEADDETDDDMAPAERDYFESKFTQLEGSIPHFDGSKYERVDVELLLRLPALPQRLFCRLCGFLGHDTPRGNARVATTSCPARVHPHLALTAAEIARLPQPARYCDL
jgi:hypothetical protein